MKCFEAYTQGPCKNEEILILPRKKSIPTCIRNNCAKGKVPFNNKCYALRSTDACQQMTGKKIQILQIDQVDLQLKCGNVSIPPRFDETDEDVEKWAGDKVCFAGSKRAQEGSC
jgi:hypothetical protein